MGPQTEQLSDHGAALRWSDGLRAALLGWLVFGEGLTAPTVAGAVLIVAGCLLAAPRKHIEQTAL